MVPALSARLRGRVVRTSAEESVLGYPQLDRVEREAARIRGFISLRIGSNRSQSSHREQDAVPMARALLSRARSAVVLPGSARRRSRVPDGKMPEAPASPSL
jgi:hypothetical protein